MTIRKLALALACAAGLHGQRRFSWQDYCFNHPAAPFCQGHEYAVKRTPPVKDAPPPASVGAGPAPSTPRTATPSVITIGGVDWRFADPSADALAGFRARDLLASPFTRNLMLRLGATEPEIQNISDRLSGLDQVALSIRDNRVVAMITGRAPDSTLAPLDAGLKAVAVSGNAMLVGDTGAVDQAIRRLEMQDSAADLKQFAEERQAASEFWAAGSAVLLGPQAARAGVKRFSLAISIRDRLTSDAAFEFDGAPSVEAVGMWPGAATIEGATVHVRMSIEPGETRQGEIASSLLGQRLAALIAAGRYLPTRDTTTRTGPVIYGLDGGPRQVKLDPIR